MTKLHCADAHIGFWAPAVPSACWAQSTTPKCVGWLNFIAASTNLAAVLVSKLGVTSWAYGPPPPLHSSLQPQSSRIIQLGIGRPAIAAFTIDKLVVLTTDLTIRSIDSSSAGQCHENSSVLFSPTLCQAMWGSTIAMVKLNGSTRKSVKALRCTFIGEDLWCEVSSSSSSVSTLHQEAQKKHQRGNRYQHAHVTSSKLGHLRTYSSSSKGQPPRTRPVLPWVSDHRG